MTKMVKFVLMHKTDPSFSNTIHTLLQRTLVSGSIYARQKRWQKRKGEYQERCWQTETWQTADGRVSSPAQPAAAGMLTASCRQTVATPVHTDCCVNMLTIKQNHAAVVLGTAVGM